MEIIKSPDFKSLSATASSALPVTFATTSSLITINGSTATIVAPGSVTVNASQPGNNYFSAAPSIAQTFCINPATPVITPSAVFTNQNLMILIRK